MLVLRGRVVPESFRFTREACKGVTASLRTDEGQFKTFAYWRAQGYRVRGAWLELCD